MSEEIFFRGLFSGIFGLIFAWPFFSRNDTDASNKSTDIKHPKYPPYLLGYMLPLYLLLLVIIVIVFLGIKEVAHLTLTMFFGIFPHISVYYLVLIFMLPLLRRYISARACVMLWIIPTYLYITLKDFMKLPSPWLVIRVSDNLVWLLLFAWLGGFVAVLLWKTIEHLLFRHHVLANSIPVTNPEILSIWQITIEDARIKKTKIKLLTSPNVKTPLSIGLFPRCIRVILPERNYNSEELALILRHEIVHISREDAWSKFFLVFCTAMCWFNPLMWLAMRKSAEDLELSCDETVLLGTNEDTRKKYATLLLDTASDERGFTTCLSASAKTMRYRLTNVLKPTKRYSGALIIGIMAFILYMSNGYVSLAYNSSTGSEVIYSPYDISQCSLTSLPMTVDNNHVIYFITDEDAFHTYLSGLTLSEFTGNYSFSDSERQFTYLMETQKDSLNITLYDNAIEILSWDEGELITSYYYIADGIDWDYLNTLITVSE